MTARFSGTQETRDALNAAFPSSITASSPNCSLVTAGGISRSVSKNLTGTGATTVNLFSLSGHVRIIEIFGEVTAVTDSTTLSGFHLEANDGTNTVDLSANTLDLSGTVVGSTFSKTGVAANALAYDVGSEVKYEESSSGPRVFTEGLLSQKYGTATYLRVAFTGDAATDVTISVCIKYEPLDSTSSLTAV